MSEDARLVRNCLGTMLSPQFELRLCQAKPGRMQEQLADLRFEVILGRVPEGFVAAKSAESSQHVIVESSARSRMLLPKA